MHHSPSVRLVQHQRRLRYLRTVLSVPRDVMTLAELETKIAFEERAIRELSAMQAVERGR